MKPEDLLGSLGEGEAGKQAWIGAREQNWEATVVRKIVRGLGLGPYWVVQKASQELTGQREMRISGLERAYPDLPVRFCSARLPGHRFGEIDDLDEVAFTRCLLYKAYQAEIELDPDNERMLVLVFPWVRDTTRVFYQGTPNLEEPGSGRFWILKRGLYVVDSLVRMLKIIGKEIGDGADHTDQD